MTRERLTTHLSELTDGVLNDWRWIQDDLNVSILGMILYGFASTGAEELGLGQEDVEAAVLHSLTEQIGAAPK